MIINNFSDFMNFFRQDRGAFVFESNGKKMDVIIDFEFNEKIADKINIIAKNIAFIPTNIKVNNIECEKLDAKNFTCCWVAICVGIIMVAGYQKWFSGTWMGPSG